MMLQIALDTNLLVDIVTTLDRLSDEKKVERVATENIIKLHDQELKICILDSVRREFLNDSGFDENRSKYFQYLRDEIKVIVQSLNLVPVMLPFTLLDNKTWSLIKRWKDEGFISDKDGLVIGCALQQKIDYLLTRDSRLINNNALKRAFKKEGKKMVIMSSSEYLRSRFI